MMTGDDIPSFSIGSRALTTSSNYSKAPSSIATVSRSESVASNCSCFSCSVSGERLKRSSILNEGVNVTDFYRFDEILGEGTFSVVYLAESKTNPGGYVAIKVMEKSLLKRDDQDLTWMIEKEASILSNLDHPHIVHLNEVFYEETRVCFVMELAKGGEVFDRLVECGSFNEKETTEVIVQLLYAVKYMHDQGIIHRDLKLENILYYNDSEDSKVMVADFGLSEWHLEVPSNPAICGTPGYMAPEVLANKYVSPANDVWSIGVIAYILLSGYPPFFPNCAEEEDEDQALIELIIKGSFEFHQHSWVNVSDQAKDFISKLMCVDPVERLTCDEALEHPWLDQDSSRSEANNHHLLEDNRGHQIKEALKSSSRTFSGFSIAPDEAWNSIKSRGIMFVLAVLILILSYIEFITFVFNLTSPIGHLAFGLITRIFSHLN